MPERRPNRTPPTDSANLSRFRINPALFRVMQDTINSTHLSTMALGVESRRDECLERRQEMKDALTQAEDPLCYEQQRALEVGFLYGSLLVRSTGENTTAQDAPEGFMDALRSVKEGLDLTTESGSQKLLERIYYIEVDFTGADVLATCLGETQDHMAELFASGHMGNEQLDAADIMQLQALYYAGALVGALTCSEQELPKVG